MINHLEYIINQIEKYKKLKWDNKELETCLRKLHLLSHDELMSIYNSKLLSPNSIIRERILEILLEAQFGKREERVRKLEISELISEFMKRSGNVSLIRYEMRERFKSGKDCSEIRQAFMNSSKSDVQWMITQDRKKRRFQ